MGFSGFKVGALYGFLGYRLSRLSMKVLGFNGGVFSALKSLASVVCWFLFLGLGLGSETLTSV